MASDGKAIARIIAKGEWFPANSSRSVEAELRAENGEMRADWEGGTLAFAAFERMQFSARVGQIPRRVSFPDGSVFETRNNDAIDSFLRERGGVASGAVHRLERFHPRLIALTLAVVLLAMSIYRFALPLLVEVAVLVTPPVVPQMIGQGTIASLDRTVFAPSELLESEKRSIAEGFSGLASHAAGGKDAYKLNFRSGGVIGPNAFALPDGSLVLTDELVKLAGGDTEMVMGVLGHEIAHVEKKHSLRQLYRAAGIAGLVLLIAGDVGSGVEDILTQGGGLLALSYSRGAEAEADRRSVELMQAAGRDPAALARFFELLQSRIGDAPGPNILSSHPGTAERMDAIRTYAAELKSKPQAR